MWKDYLSHLVCLKLGYYKAAETEYRYLDFDMMTKEGRMFSKEGILTPQIYMGQLSKDVRDKKVPIVYIYCTENDPYENFIQ